MSMLTLDDQTRLDELKAQILTRKGSFVTGPAFARKALDLATWRAYKPGISRVQWRAAALKEQVRLAHVDILPDWSLAGEHLPMATSMSGKGPETGAVLGEEMELTDSERQEMETCARFSPFLRKKPFAPYLSGEVDEIAGGALGFGSDGRDAFWGLGWMENHSIRDYSRLLECGYAGLLQEVTNQWKCMEISDPEYPRRKNFLLAAATVCEAGILLGERYAQKARDLATTADKADCARFLRIAETCEKVPAQGAQTFYEAVQALWLAHVLTCGEDGINANSIGRLDQILYPYYKTDIEAKRLTRAEAVALMQEFACKLYLEYDVQAITLGGTDADGNDATNDLSYVILEATENVGFIRDLCVRIHPNSPHAFIRRSAELVCRGGGIPFFFNDACFVGALADRGIALQDARDYAPIGCVELTIPGKANPRAVSGWFNALKCLELALYGGVEPQTGKQVGPVTPPLEQMRTYEEFFAAYKTQVEALARRMVYCCNVGELQQQEACPLPCWSLLTDDCIARGRDITDGGAKYNYHSVCFMGTADTADSLVALKTLYFEEKRFSAQELLGALKGNFEDNEELRQLLKNAAPKYGNDNEEVDRIAADVANHFIDLMDTMASPSGGKYFVHLFSFLLNIGFGKEVGATPDGRFDGEPIAYSLSAHQGRDETSLTAMLGSLARLPHGKAAGGSAAILDITPRMVEGEKGGELLATIIETATGMGIGQLQFNVVTAEQMLRAKEDPETYGNLPVRVAGYSQKFRLLDEDLQDHVIARTKHEA